VSLFNKNFKQKLGGPPVYYSGSDEPSLAPSGQAFKKTKTKTKQFEARINVKLKSKMKRTGIH
jgi:hypothetical protein